MAEFEAQQRQLQQQLREIDEQRLQHQRESQLRLREIDERHNRRVRSVQQRLVVMERQRRGVADAA